MKRLLLIVGIALMAVLGAMPGAFARENTAPNSGQDIVYLNHHYRGGRGGGWWGGGGRGGGVWFSWGGRPAPRYYYGPRYYYHYPAPRYYYYPAPRYVVPGPGYYYYYR